VGATNAFDISHACGKAQADLMQVLAGKECEVTQVSNSQPIDDWLLLAKSKVLICTFSSFCLSAALSNTNRAYLASNWNGGSLTMPRLTLAFDHEGRRNSPWAYLSPRAARP